MYMPPIVYANIELLEKKQQICISSSQTEWTLVIRLTQRVHKLQKWSEISVEFKALI